ncbi:hypothetical protein QBC39DRAFT_335470 [Podospora conica]|nr:hypothetical protein QBC39DRAFT_335470 [Schizothecium conicum]
MVRTSSAVAGSSGTTSHPGGSTIVNAYAGSDATVEFKREHANWEALLKGMTKVGDIVPEFSIEPAFPHPPPQRDLRRVLDLPGHAQDICRWPLPLAPTTWDRVREDAKKQFARIREFLGKDVRVVTTELAEVFVPLNRLAHLIVGSNPRLADESDKEIEDTIPTMPVLELARHNELRGWLSPGEQQSGLFKDPV